MAEVRVITAMCKSRQVEEAYELAKKDYVSDASSPWAQRALGWALYYMIKTDVENGSYDKLIEHIKELKELNLLTVANDNMIFDNVQLQMGTFIKKHIPLNDNEAPVKLSTLFHLLRDYSFNSSLGHSVLLQSYIKFDAWSEMADFLDWWNLDTFRDEDFTPFVTPRGNKVTTLVEQAFNANSKALLRQDDLGRIEEFLPKLDSLMTSHPEMMYPGYFYGKLLLKLGSNTEEALKVIVPFVRKKASEFWAWQLLSDVYAHDPEKQLACLLRAVHCKTQETFLGKVRIKLASTYIQMNQLGRARHHIDIVTRCYASQGWNLPNEVECWIHQPWFNTTTPNGNDAIDFLDITNKILCDGTKEAIAIVTYVDPKSHKATIVYGLEKRMAFKFKSYVGVCSILKINYIEDADGKVKILNTAKATLPNNLEYIKVVTGVVSKHEKNDFAFLKSSVGSCFIPGDIVGKYNVVNGEQIKVLAVYAYNRKKEVWNWICVSIKR